LGQRKEANGEAIAKNLLEMSRLKAPIICIIIGEGSSGGALALGIGDKILMLENAVYSVLSPEGFASILYKDSSKNEQAAEEMKITATDLKQLKIIDEIIKEPEGGAQNDILQTCLETKKAILKNLKLLQNFDTETLIENRYNKFRIMGQKFIQ
jgi:acetyl-CoA carboxylase carboxyl transferase subunit alpha